jgi:hypothetical protein
MVSLSMNRLTTLAAVLLAASGLNAAPALARTFHDPGTRANVRFGWWQAARPALLTRNTQAHAARGGTADFDWVRVRTLSRTSP